VPKNSELVKLRMGCLNWINNNLENFNPINADGTHNFLHSKALTELSFACYCFKRKLGTNTDEYSNKFVSFTYEILQNPIYREIPAKNPALLILHATQYLALVQFGFEDNYLKEIIQRTISQGYLSSVERPPFRIMDLCYTFTKAGFVHQFPPLEELYKRTILAKSPSVLLMTMPDVYSVTHTIFYLSDWGFDSPKISKNQLSRIRWTVNQLLELYLLKQNWDLTLELLLCCKCLNSFPEILYESAWTQILKAQQKDGSIPGPFHSDHKCKKEKAKGKKTEPFNENYHTTLIGLLLSTLSL
jgi:hypothetical protein